MVTGKGTKKRRVGGVLLLAAVLFLLMGCTSCGASGTVHLNMGSTSSSSGVYAWCVATANAINASEKGILVTVIESGAGMDNLRKVRDGVFDFALAVDLPSALQLYKGTDGFEGRPFPELRWLLLRNIVADRLYVLRDSGVRTFGDLSGKRFSPGIPGSASATYIMQYDAILGTGIRLVPSALGDALGALREKRIVGLQKSSGLDSMDASLVEVNLTTPDGYRVLKGGCAEDLGGHPHHDLPAEGEGEHQGFPGRGPHMGGVPIAGAVSTSAMPEEVGYGIVRAYVERFEEIAAAYGPIRGLTPCGTTLKGRGRCGPRPRGAHPVRQGTGHRVPVRYTARMPMMEEGFLSA